MDGTEIIGPSGKIPGTKKENVVKGHEVKPGQTRIWSKIGKWQICDICRFLRKSQKTLKLFSYFRSSIQVYTLQYQFKYP